jgi:hypothetical protein
MNLALHTLGVFAFYQWRQHCTSPVLAFVSAVSLFIVLCTLFTVGVLIMRMSRQLESHEALLNEKGHYIRSWGTLYDTLHGERLYFVIVSLLTVVINSAIVGFGQGNGLVQIILLIVLQSVIVISK